MTQINLVGLEEKKIKTFHDFEESLRWAEKHSGILQLEQFYKSQFPDVAKVIKVGRHTQKELNLQKQGIDTIVELNTGKCIYFDEKIRDTDWGDFFLEEYSIWPRPQAYAGWKQTLWIFPSHSGNLERIQIGKRTLVPREYEEFLTRGWIHGKKITDYITYVIKSTGRVNLLPFLLLQRAWDEHYQDWLRKYSRKVVPNRNHETGYVWFTTGIAVPRNILLNALYEKADWKSI